MSEELVDVPAAEDFGGAAVDSAEEKFGNDDDDVGAGDDEKRWPGWPGDNVFRILIPANKVGSIIGRKGEFIKKMCEESRARIKVIDGPPGTPERAVMISAKEEPDVLISPAMDGLLRVHRRVVDGLDGESARIPPVAGNSVSRLLVTASQAASLIGKHGSTIKSIQEASNCNLRILDELPPFALQDDRVVEILGEATGMHKAVELISGHLRKFLLDRSVLPLFEVQMPARAPPHMEQSMLPPQPWGQPHGPPPGAAGVGYGGNPHYPPVPRPHDNFYPPHELPYFEKQPHHAMPNFGRDVPPMGMYPSANQHPPPTASQVTNHMQIPLSFADAVIGASGVNISYIRRASGAAVIIQETRGIPGEMTVEINGSASQVQAAQQLIQNYMAEAAPAAAVTAAAATAPPPAFNEQSYGAYQNQGPGAPPPGGGFASAYGGANYGY